MPNANLVFPQSAKRELVRIYQIDAKKIISDAVTNIKSKNLITSPVDSIAFMVNEYIPEHFVDRTYIEYKMTVNGVDYDMTPLNSQRPGIKVIRMSPTGLNTDYVLYIKESIRSAILSIKMVSTDDNESPFLSNIKICYGKVVTPNV